MRDFQPIRRAVLPIALLAVLLCLTAGTASASPARTFCPQGTGAGHCQRPPAVAVDQSSGTIYVADENNFRVDEFDAAETFQSAFGWGVQNGAAELQTCTAATACRSGLQGTGAGEIRPSGIAVDNDPLSSSHRDVYVVDAGNHRIEKFEADGDFLISFGATKLTTQRPPVFVDASGDIWAGDQSRAMRFSETGAFLSEVELPGLGEITALAVDSSGNFYAIGSAVAGVHKFAPDGTQFGAPYPLDASGNAIALGLDPASGNLIVGDCPGGSENASCQGPYSLRAYASSGVQTEVFGTGAPIGHPYGNAIAVGEGGQRLYIASGASDQESAVQSLELPPPGPLPEEGSEMATVVKKTTATLNARVNPEGKPTTCEFQYVDVHSFETEGGFAAPQTETTPSSSIGEDFAEHACSAAITDLATGVSYRFRVVAHNENAPPGGIFGEGAGFSTQPPFTIGATYATEVTATGATLAAVVNPLGEAASYRFEYLSNAEYEANGNSFAGTNVPTAVPAGYASLPAAEGDLTVSRHISGLTPQTGYRYRLAVHDAIEPSDRFGAEPALITSGPGGPLVLPDQRAWEMVSPIDKNGGGISGINQGTYVVLVQAAADGEAITYGSPVAFAGPAGSPPGNSYLSVRRGEAGWSTENIGIPTSAESFLPLGDAPYKAFSTDLSASLLSAGDGKADSHALPPEPEPLPGTEAAPGFGNFYLRQNSGPSYRAVLTEAGAGTEASLPLVYENATPDLRHVVFSEEEGKHGLFVWSEGRLDQINFLPGKSTPTKTSNGLGNGERQVGPSGGLHDLRALSSDGSRAVWAASPDPSQPTIHNLYLRQNIGSEPTADNKCSEPDRACTIQIDASEGGTDKGGTGAYLASSADATQIYFADHQRLTPDSTADQLTGDRPQLGDLYRFEPDAEAGHRLTDLTVDHTDPGGAGVLGVLGSSDDGSYLYFVANGVLTTSPNARGEHAASGDCAADQVVPQSRCNLYLFHSGTTTFIASLAGHDIELESDVVSLGAGEGTASGSWAGVGYRTARVNPDGTHVLFTSYASLTGYDNLAANGSNCGTSESGQPLPLACPQVFRYAAPGAADPDGDLSCLSCNPTGGRPLGLSAVPTGTRSSVREWEGMRQSRSLSLDGSRAFFDSYDALVPQDTNGRLDVYEWEQAGAGTCSGSSSTFSPASGGCVSLISSGTGAENSEFMDASANGSDVFFRTGSSLVKQDPGSVDLYDARVGGGLPEPPPPPASCQGDACQSPSPAPNDPTPASATFNGPANEVPPSAKKAKKHKRKHHKRKRQGKHHRAGAKPGGAR